MNFCQSQTHRGSNISKGNIFSLGSHLKACFCEKLQHISSSPLYPLPPHQLSFTYVQMLPWEQQRCLYSIAHGFAFTLFPLLYSHPLATFAKSSNLYNSCLCTLWTVPMTMAARKVPEENPYIPGVSPACQALRKPDFPNDFWKQVSQHNYLAKRQKDLSDILFKII